MNYKMPYYIAYPDVDYVDEDKMCKRDMEYMRNLYPRMAKLALPFIEEECDRLEYEGSLIYDAYPDKLMLHLMCGRISRKTIASMEKRGENLANEDLVWLREMIEVLVYQELCKRREKWRKNKRRWY